MATMEELNAEMIALRLRETALAHEILALSKKERAERLAAAEKARADRFAAAEKARAARIATAEKYRADRVAAEAARVAALIAEFGEDYRGEKARRRARDYHADRRAKALATGLVVPKTPGRKLGSIVERTTEAERRQKGIEQARLYHAEINAAVQAFRASI